MNELKYKRTCIGILITALFDIIVMILTFKNRSVSWYLVVMSVINVLYFLPHILSKESVFVIIAIASCYYVFHDIWLGVLVGFIWWVIIYDLETMLLIKKQMKSMEKSS